MTHTLKEERLPDYKYIADTAKNFDWVNGRFDLWLEVYMASLKPENTQSWEKEFDEKFVAKTRDYKHSFAYARGEYAMNFLQAARPTAIKSFISSLLLKAREEERKMIRRAVEVLKAENVVAKPANHEEEIDERAYNAALQAVLAALSTPKKEEE